MRRLAWLSALLFGAMCNPADATDCTSRAVARVALHDNGGVLSVPARLDGRAVEMVLDTGSEGGLVTPEAAKHLSVDAGSAPPPIALPLYGANGGRTLARVVSVADLQLGDEPDALHASLATVPVSRLPFQPMLHPPIAGLIGADLLSHFELELDLPRGRAVLYAPRDAACAPAPGWAGPRAATRVPLLRLGDRLAAAVRLDGQPISALIDTGARSRVVALRAAIGIGVDEAALAADSGGTSAGFGPLPGIYRWHRFHSFDFAGEHERDVTLTVARLDDVADMLLGADWFAAHHVWISWTAGALWVAAPSGR